VSHEYTEEAEMEIERRKFLQTMAAGLGAAIVAPAVLPISAHAKDSKSDSQMRTVKSEGEVLVEWLGHGSFRFDSPGGKTILLDPWLSTNPKCPAKYRTMKEPAKVDIVLFTHGHVDHFMLQDTRDIVERYDPKIVAGFELQFLIKAKLPKANTLVFQLANKGAPCEIDGLKIAMVDADHSAGAQFTGFEGVCEYAGEPVGYVIEFENGLKIYHSGDTGLMTDMKTVIGDFYEPDVAILPIGGVFTMGPKEAAYACKLIRPKVVIPEHYGTFPVLVQSADEFVGFVKDYAPKTKVIVMTPGEPIMV
jgi:L-ascorbate metabolism protein UlaG (beta-lactamase superfamily)